MTSGSCPGTHRSWVSWSTAWSKVRTPERKIYVAAVQGGFLSVANDRVSILAEYAEMSHEIDLEAARQELERARAAGENDQEALEHVRRAEARVRAVEMAS